VNELDTDDQPGYIERQVRRHRIGDTMVASDNVGQEWPVALVFNGISHAVMMCTPRDLEAFAVGFSITEGIVERGSDIHDIEVFFRDSDDATSPHAEVHLQVVQQAFVALKDKRRALAGRTGCGVCGIESIELLDLQPEHVPDTGFLARLADDAIARAARELPAHQQLTKLTGGLHAAAWCDASGAVRYAFEDVGRHNALDKVVGWAFRGQLLPLAGYVLCVSGRLSFELVQKAAVAGCPLLVAVGAPSSLAVDLAADRGITLCGFVRGDRVNVYTCAWRLSD
jgi:FdhD protein